MDTPACQAQGQREKVFAFWTDGLGIPRGSSQHEIEQAMRRIPADAPWATSDDMLGIFREQLDAARYG